MRPVRQHGVTLVELAVTVSLAVLLLVAVGPSLQTWQQNTQVRNVASSVIAGLQKARSEAVRRNQPVRFALVSLTDSAVMDDTCRISPSGVSWVVSLDDPEGACSTAVSETTSPRIIDKRAGGVGPRNVVVGSRNAAGATSNGVVVFNGFGRLVGTDGIASIDLDHVVSGGDYRALRVLIGTGGATTLCEPRVTSTDDPRHC